ncbi:MAG: hypothetical protein RJB38_1560 [Pseudomonadota bacterium]|jgi:hypothetical protein
MIIYEVNIAVQNDAAPDYERFLERHIPKILQIDGFRGASWWERLAKDENVPEMKGSTLWTVHYHVESRKALDSYLINQAPAMRAEAVELFGNKISINRRILNHRSSQGLSSG